VSARPLEITFGATRARREAPARGGATVVGIVPSEAPWYSERLPSCVVRDMRNRTADVSLEHLRLTPAHAVGLLPSLSSPGGPSMIADAVHTALRAGAPWVDVLLLRAVHAARHDFTQSAIREQLLAYLPELWGAVLCFPDLRAAPAAATLDLVRMLRPHWGDLFLVACLDAPTDGGADPVVRAATGADAAVCAWTGDPDALELHSWRSPAAVVAGLLSADLASPGRSLARRPVRLPPPRQGVTDRSRMLTPHVRVPAPEEMPEDPVVHVEIDGIENVAIVRSEPSLRRPLGAWPLPAVYTAKHVRRVLREAADRFVFRPVTEQEAIALSGAMSLALRPFIEKGLLVGANGKGAPSIEPAVVRDPSFPGLAVTVTAYLRPWMHRVALQVRVRASDRPTVVEV